MIYCYIRVSTERQEFVRQQNILKERGYINGENCIYYTEHYTGKTGKIKSRPVFNELYNKLMPGDTLVATDLSRLSRSVTDFNNLVEELLKKRKVNITILKENFNLLANGQMDAMTKLIMNITASFAEFERDIISDRTKEGLRARTEMGIVGGAKRTERSTPQTFINTLEYMVKYGVGITQACSALNTPKNTFNNDLKKCYEKYKTKDYRTILEKYKKEHDL